MTTPSTTQTSTRNTPRVRAELAARLKELHRSMVQQAGHETTLKVYCHALCEWATDPNTDLYHVERLFDEIHHASRQENLDDWDDTATPA